MKIRFNKAKSTVLLAVLGLLGFSACDKEDIQPEYGVRPCYGVRVTAPIPEQQTESDAKIQEHVEFDVEDKN